MLCLLLFALQASAAFSSPAAFLEADVDFCTDGALGSDSESCASSPIKIAFHNEGKVYWGAFAGWKDAKQCSHMCMPVDSIKDADVILRPGHIAPADYPDMELSDHQTLVIVMYEGWHTHWEQSAESSKRPQNVEVVMGYSPKSDFWLPIDCPGILSLIKTPPEPFNLDKYAQNYTGAPVAMFVSNCNDYNDRTGILQELQRWIRVDSFGKCLPTVRGNDTTSAAAKHVGPYKTKAQMKAADANDSPHEMKLRRAREYPFVIAMQNQNNFVESFANEKLFDAFRAGALPIYLGPSDLSFLGYLESDPYFVNVDAFARSADLAKVYRVKDLADAIQGMLSPSSRAYAKMLASSRRVFSRQSRAPIVQRCLELEAMGHIFRNEERYEEYVSHVFCAACEAVVSQRRRRKKRASNQEHLNFVMMEFVSPAANGHVIGRGETMHAHVRIMTHSGDVVRLHHSCTVCVRIDYLDYLDVVDSDEKAACGSMTSATTRGISFRVPDIAGDASLSASLRCGGEAILGSSAIVLSVK